MITLRDKQSQVVLGSITEEDLQFLIDQLEEEASDDQDYYINKATMNIFKEEGASSALIALLTEAMGDKDDLEIAWSRD